MAAPPNALASVDGLIGEGGPRHRRRKLLLDAYRQAATQKDVTEVANDPSNIDSPAFDADQFYKTLLRTKRLDVLRQIENILNKKVTHLDGSMKTLVYENYNKFISATDTIREMQKHTDSMEDEMYRLKEKMEKIEESSEAINQTIGPRRERIEELTAISRLLKKREFLFQLPARLEHCVEMGALNQTVEYYTKTVGILKKYSHMSSFDSILKDCQRIMDGVTEVLKERVGSMNSTSSEAADAVEMLLKLKYPRSSLWPLFLETRADALEASLPKSAEKEKGEEEEEDICAFIQELNPTFLGAYLEMASNFRSLFTMGDVGHEDVREAEIALESRSKSLFNTFLHLIRSKISKAEDPEEVKQALIHLHRNMENVNAAFPKLGISEKSNAAIRETIYRHMEKKFQNLQKKAESYMREMDVALSDLWVVKKGAESLLSDEDSLSSFPSPSPSSPSPSPSSPLHSSLSGGINPSSSNLLFDIADAAFQSTINEIRQFVQNQTTFLTVGTGMQGEVFGRHKQSVSMKICLKVQQLFLCLNELALQKAQEAGSDPEMKKVRACYLLCLSQYCSTFRTTGVRSVQRTLKELPTEAEYVQLQTAALADRLQDCTVELLRQYVAAQARRLSTMIRKTIDTPDWMETKEPRGVRPVLDMIFDEFKTIDKEICHVFQDINEDEKFEVQIHQQKPTKPNQKFGKKLDVHLTVRMERKSMLTAIIHLFLKSFLEAVRLKTFGRCGFNQMQLDLAFTAAVLGTYIGADKVGELTDEVFHSVSERCVNPEPFKHAVVESICKAKLGIEGRDL